MGYLSNAGLSYFFGKLKTIFAPISHGHGGATQSAAGFMSAADKKKLDGIAEGANKYSLPTATSSVLGGVKTGANITNSSGTISLTKANVTGALGYTPPTQDTNTWRPVVNGLNSTATDQSLAAAQGKILNESKAAMLTLTNENLNDVKTPGFYNAGGSNAVTNKPSNVDHFGLIVIHRATGSYYTQIVYTDSAAYRRHCVNGTWSGWVQDKLTDTDTWRGIQNNLTSDSTTDSLSAAQGKALKALVDGKAASGHTHKSVIDNGDGTNTTTFAYSKAGMNYGDYTWLAGWNGYELRAINKNQFATASHNHNIELLTNFSSKVYDATISRTAATVLAAPASANGVATFRTLTKSDVGLSSVDNTADSAKSVKYATSAGSANTAAKATTADSATTAITSKSLQLLSSVRPTSMNFNLAGTDYLGKITYQIATASTTTGKPPCDSGVLNFSWDNSGWGAQVAVANNNNPRMYVRGATTDNGVSKWDTSWKTVAFTDDKPAAAGTADVANSVDWSKVQNKPATYAPAAHTHTWDSVTGKPSTFTPSSHTHNYAGSSSAGGAATSANKVNAALTINLNGTSQGAWDGSSAKSISITAASVGATSVTISRW